MQWFYWKEYCFYIFRSRWGKMTWKEFFQHEHLMKIFKIFCMEYGGKNLNPVSCFWGKSCTESFGQKGIQLKLMYWVFLILCMRSYHSIWILLDKIVLKLDCQSSKKKYCLLEWKPFKNDEKNAFYIILKALFVFKIFKFLFWLFGHIEKNSLIRKIRLILKFMTSQPDQQIITIHILSTISWSKGNQTMKIIQLIKHNKRNVFLQKSCRNWDRKTNFRPLFVFLKRLYIR